MAAGGGALVAAGLVVLVRNRAVGDALAEIENGSTGRASLLNQERIQRIKASVDNPRSRFIDRGHALFLGLWLIIVGGALAAQAFV